MGQGAGNIIYQSLFGPVERCTPSSGLKKKRTILFLEISRGFSVYFVGRIGEAAMGGPLSSFRGRRSSVGGSSLAQKGAA
jgi:hypothetical protein